MIFTIQVNILSLWVSQSFTIDAKKLFGMANLNPSLFVYKITDESTTLSLTETGTWVGPGDIKEYVDFVLSDLFNVHGTASDQDVRLISASI